MPIELNFNLTKEFEESDLKKIRSYRKTSIILAIIGVILNFFIFIGVVFLNFRNSGVGFYLFDYSNFIDTIDICYWITWAAIILASASLFLNIYLLRFTINPFIIILKSRKDQNKEELKKKIENYKKTVSYRMLLQLFLWIGMIIHLIYYPRNVALFYPYIGCNPYTGICLITDTIYFQFSLIMTGFFIIFIGLYLSVVIINLKEVLEIQKMVYPLKTQRKLEKKQQQLEMIKMRQELSIEEKRKLKIEQLREKHRLKTDKKRKKLKNKYKKMLEKEQYGKRGYKKLKKEIQKEGLERVQKIKKKKDEYDFT